MKVTRKQCGCRFPEDHNKGYNVAVAERQKTLLQRRRHGNRSRHGDSGDGGGAARGEVDSGVFEHQVVLANRREGAASRDESDGKH
jgi:hypothetical protein